MILDKGICTVFHVTDSQTRSRMPAASYTAFYQSWYGELSFETAPSWLTEGRRELKTDARIRILQNRDIRQNDVVALEDVSSIANASKVYRVTRAYHGAEDNILITDLSLEVFTP